MNKELPGRVRQVAGDLWFMQIRQQRQAYGLLVSIDGSICGKKLLSATGTIVPAETHSMSQPFHRSMHMCSDNLAAVRWSFVTSKEALSSKSRFFDVVVDVIRTFEGHHFTFGQMACLGLCNLSHSTSEVRRTAYRLLEELHRQSEGQLSLTQFESAIGSSAPTIHLQAQ